jgi:O-antigen ligase
MHDTDCSKTIAAGQARVTTIPKFSAFPSAFTHHRVPFMPSARVLPPAAAVARYEPRLQELLSLRPWRTEMVVIIAYLLVTRIGSLGAAKVGIQVGPVPLFLTDMTLISLFVIVALRYPGRLLFWASSGTQAGVAGFAIWILCWLAVVYFLVAFPVYHIYAVRDLAIFEYSLFFPLTYLAIPSRTWAVRLSRYFVYAGVVLGMLLLIQITTGVNLGFSGEMRIAFGRTLNFEGGGDLGGALAFSLVALVAYFLCERHRRRLHFAAAMVCFIALAASGTRSAFVGVLLAGTVTFMLTAPRGRFTFMSFAAILGGLIALGATVPDSFPGATSLQKFYFTVTSGMAGLQDANGAFRLVRWKDVVSTWLQSPVLGVGFGGNILHEVYVRDWSPDRFNVGMPHNTFLFLLARMGFIGFGLVVFSWVVGIVRIGRVAYRSHQPDDLAAVNILVAMAGFAMFVLFFERPMNNASFWIVLAIAQRLADTRHSSSGSSLGWKPLAALRAAPPAGIDPELR